MITNKYISYESRYSHTDKPDKHGRWARKCFYKKLHIAWINRVEVEDKIRYSITTHFPVSSNDMPCYLGNEITFDDAKEKINKLWSEFLDKLIS